MLRYLVILAALGVTLGAALVSGAGGTAGAKPAPQQAIFPDSYVGHQLSQMCGMADLTFPEGLNPEDPAAVQPEDPEEVLRRHPEEALTAIRDGLKAMGEGWGPERVRLIRLVASLDADKAQIREILREQMMKRMPVDRDGRPEEAFYAPATAFAGYLELTDKSDLPKARAQLMEAYVKQKSPKAREALLARWFARDSEGAMKAPGASKAPHAVRDFAAWLDMNEPKRSIASEKKRQ